MAQSHRQILHKMFLKIEAHYQHVLSLLLIVISISVVYREDLEILLNEALQSEALSHLLLMPFFAGFLFYQKRDMIKASLTLEKLKKKPKTEYINEITGVAVCLIAFLLYWYGSRTFYPLEFHLLSLPIFVAGVTLILFNLKTLTVIIFPILFLFFIVPPPTEFMYQLGGTMADFNTQAAYTILKTAGLPVNFTYSYGLPTIALPSLAPFSIDLPCSGMYTIIAFSMFAAFLALIVSAPLSKKIALFALGFLIFETLNILRITAIVSIGYWFGESVAMLIFHTVAGILLIFTGIVITLLVAEKALKIQLLPQTKKQMTCSECETDSTTFENFCSSCGRFLKTARANVSRKLWVKLILLTLGCSLMTLTIHAPTFAIAEDSVEVSSTWQDSTNLFPSSITDEKDVNYTLCFLYRDKHYERIAHQDVSLMYAYYPAPHQGNEVVHVDLGVANSISDLHNWEVCLIALQTIRGRYPLVSVQDSRDILLLEDASIIARFLVFKDKEGSYLPKNYTQFSLYWYERATFNTGITVEQKYVRITLIIWTNSTEHQQLEDQLLTFGQHIASHWKPLKSQSVVSIGVPAQQILLVFSIGMAVFTKTAEHFSKIRQRRNNLEIFSRHASTEERLVLQTIEELSEDRKKLETREINQAIINKTGKPPDFDSLLNTLRHLQEYGFVKTDIIAVGNQPKLVWTRQLPGSYKP